MTRRFRRFLARGILGASVVLSVSSAVVLRRVGAPPVPPPPGVVARPSTVSPDTAGIRATPLIDYLDSAVLEGPSTEASVKRFHAIHWRSMKAPWSGLTSGMRKRVELVALTTSVTERASPTAALGGWQPELKTWNMAEGSFEAREAVLLPPPSRLRLPVRIPRGAWLELAPAILGLRTGNVTFEVAATTRHGVREILSTVKISAGDPPAWHETKVSLAAYADQEIELEIRTRTSFVGEPPTALIGTPTLFAPAASVPPYNVLFIVVDALRPDALASFHTKARDERTHGAKVPPLEAVLPAMPTVVPNLDALAATGTSFADATSAASWTRPGTLAMLTGMRSGELGLDSTQWILPDGAVGRFYAGKPPLLALSLRRAGMRTQAIVNNYFLTGYARAGLDAGFAAMVDHRDEIRDSDLIVKDARAFLERHGQERFFLFLNFNSPHHPYEPGAKYLRRVPKPPQGPKDQTVRSYLGEIAKDDAAVGEVLAKLDERGLREKTLVIVTADHGETLSAAHDFMVPDLDQGTKPMRFHHANAMFEETARIPLLISLPGRVPAGRVVESPVQNTDIVPTILAIEGLPTDPRQSGKSLLPLTEGAPTEPERPVVTEGRAARAIRVGRWRYVERDAAAQHVTSATEPSGRLKEELYDLEEDPGERRNVAPARQDVAATMREHLASALSKSTAPDTRKSAALAGSRHLTKEDPRPAKLHLRFAGRGAPRRFSLTVHLPTPEKHAPEPTWRASVVELDPEALRVDGPLLTLTATTARDALVGVDLEVDPPATPLTWEITLDDAPLDPSLVLAGAFGLAAPSVATGMRTVDDRLILTSDTSPYVDPRRDLGVFLTRDPAGDLTDSVRPTSDAALKEVGELLEAWGYANKGAAQKGGP